MEAANFNSVDEAGNAIENTYNASAGTDIFATIDGILLGNINGISWSTTREKSKS